MPPNPISSTGVDRVGANPAIGTSGTGAVSPTRALVRIAPVAPQGPLPDPTQPLGRSGLDLLDVLGTTDVLAARGPTGTVALEVGLEQARGALLRNLPGDALSALDQVWERAQRTEEGWYLRSGALTVMGLPGECERVAEEGIAQRPHSVALRFVQSVARLAMGDSVGARAVLQPALQLAAHETVLQVQDALALARQGDERRAHKTLAALELATPDDPAIAWGRQALRSIVADATRLRSRPTPSDWPLAIGELPANDSPLGADVVRSDVVRSDVVRSAADMSAIRVENESADVAASALERFGARVALRPPAEVAREARMLLRAFSAGGTLASATRPEQAHAARVVLTAFLSGAADDSAHVPLPVRALVSQLVPLLQQGQASDAESLVRRQSGLAREPIGRLLLAIVRGAWMSCSREDQRDVVDQLGTAAPGTIRDAVDRGPVVPIRLGLTLLDESSASRHAAADMLWPNRSLTEVTGRHTVIGDGAPAPDDRFPIDTVRNPEVQGIGWGAAAAAASTASSNEWADGAGIRAVAVVCVALATLALVTGHGAIAIGLAAGAAWMGLRRSGRERGAHQSLDEVNTPQTPPSQ